MASSSALKVSAPLLSPASPQRAEALLASVRKMVPVLRERALETEELRRVPERTIAELDAIGAFKMCVPVEYGGYALLPSQIVPIFAELARGCGSTAWVVWVTSAGTQWISHFARSFLDEMFGTPWVGPLQSGAMSKIGPGSARRVPGGYMVHGKWPWASGCHHTKFHTLGAMVEVDGGGKEAIVCQVPHADIEILDDWFVMGMRGSGSNTIVVRDEIFVPAHRVVRSADLFGGKRQDFTPEGVLFRVPLIQFTPGTLLALGVGLARTAIELLEERSKTRGITFTDYRVQNEAPVTHLQFGELHVKLNAVEAILARSVARMEHDAEAGTAMNPVANATAKASSAYGLQVCREIVDVALRANGASAIQSDNPAQRLSRDAMTLTMHGQMNIETAYEELGRLVAGLPGFGAPKPKPS